MDPAGRICIGCGRTLDEIARWGSMTDAERTAIMSVLGARISGTQHDTASPDARGIRAVPER
jgi:predicted Fe-S protein YdhL (DUF1289 family)